MVMRSARPKGAVASYPPVLADVGHGSHVCAFYETHDDLLDLVLSFFAGGVDRGDVFVWMTPDGISEDEVRRRAGEAIVKSGLELRPARDLVLRNGRFARDQVTRFFEEKARQALASHHCGTHTSADTFWVQKNDWHTFLEHEADLNAMIADMPVALLCTYPFSVSKTGDVFDVVRAHRFAIAKREHDWELLVAPAVNPDAHAEAAEAAARVASLTPRERQVLDAIIDGRPNKVIARELSIDVRTVEAHRARLLRRLGVRTMVEAVRLGTMARFVASMPPSATV